MRALLLLCVPALAAAQPAKPVPPAPTPAQALAKVEATYAKATTITGTFTQTALNTTFGTTRVSGGTFAIAKPDKLRFEYVSKKKKLDKIFLFDGATLWYEEPLNRTVTKASASASDMPAALAFLVNPGQLARSFAIAAPADPGHLVPGSVVLELTPKQTSVSVAKIELVADPATWTVARSIVYAPSGDKTTYDLSAVDLAAKLPADRFAYAPPKGYRVRVEQPAAPAKSGTPADPKSPKKSPAAPPKRP